MFASLLGFEAIRAELTIETLKESICEAEKKKSIYHCYLESPGKIAGATGNSRCELKMKGSLAAGTSNWRVKMQFPGGDSPLIGCGTLPVHGAVSMTGEGEET